MKLLPEGTVDHERITDLYIIIIFFGFLLFPGFSGYRSITLSKYVFLMAATGLWLTALAVSLRRERARLPRLRAPQCAALAFLAVCVLSWLCSPWRGESLVGGGRYDGLLTALCYGLMFLGVSLFTRPKRIHFAALAAGVTLCCVIGMLQLFGWNPLGLFPTHSTYGVLTYYDSGTLYSSAYLGTIGNTNILDAVLCAALPLFLALYIGGESPLFLIPLFPGVFVVVSAGGAGAFLALGVCALCAAPLLVTDLDWLRRALRGAAVVLFAAALALLWKPAYTDRVLYARFVFSGPVLCLLIAAAAALALSALRLPGFAPSKNVLRRCFLALDAAAVLGGLALVWFWPGGSGTLYELNRVLRGQLDDSFGSSRVLIWRACLALLPERPLLGGGPGTLALRLDIAFSRYVPETGATLSTFVDNAHNVWLAWLVNCGTLGLASLLALLVLTGREALRRAGDPMTEAAALGALCGAVHGCFGLGLFISEPFFWIILAMICACSQKRRS